MTNFTVIADTGNQRTRVRRKPSFPVIGGMKPFGLYPIMAHPVLPGETINSFRLKWRVISKPIVHPLAGSWLEGWLVYVKFTDLDRDLGNMFISDSYSTTGYLNSGGSDRYFTGDGMIDWIKLCSERFHDAYFMDDSETPKTIDGVRQTKLSARSFYENCMFKPADEALGTTDVFDAEKQLNAYMMMQQMGMSELSYEQYLQEYGVSQIQRAEGSPEILRYYRSWTLPVNHVEPSDGSPSTAWVWQDDVKLDKEKRFSEPGFLMFFASVRPKMYQLHQRWSFTGNLWGFSDFYPSYNLDDPTAGIKEISTADPMWHPNHRTDAGDKDLLYDHRDLLSHGEQFVNNFYTPYAPPFSTGMVANDASLNADLRGEYAAAADIDGLFTSATGTDKVCFYEGLAMADISGHIKETTPGGR